jgi:hypothetical protein
MRNERIQATNLVGAQLYAAEAALDAAITEAAKLSALLPEARMNAKIAACVVHEALGQASQTLSRLVDARDELLKTHEALDTVKTEIGLRTYSMGGGFPKGALTVPLEVVAEAA